MSRHAFASAALAVTSLCLAGSPATGAPTVESTQTESRLSQEDIQKLPTGRRWDFGLRAGYTGALHDGGDMQSAITNAAGTANLLGLPTGDSGYHPYTQGADLAFSVTAPFSFGPEIRPFVTVGGFVPGGDSTVDAGNFGWTNNTGLSNAFLEERGNFYTHVGLDVPLRCRTFDRTFHVRPYTGFDVRMYTAGLRLDESAFINPATLLPYPIVEDDSRFTRFQPKIGAEFTVPLCDHGCWGMSTYLGADYSFDVGGSKRVTTLTPGGFPAWSQVNPGNVTTIRAGFQLDLHTGF